MRSNGLGFQTTIKIVTPNKKEDEIIENDINDVINAEPKPKSRNMMLCRTVYDVVCCFCITTFLIIFAIAIGVWYALAK